MSRLVKLVQKHPLFADMGAAESTTTLEFPEPAR